MPDVSRAISGRAKFECANNTFREQSDCVCDVKLYELYIKQAKRDANIFVFRLFFHADADTSVNSFYNVSTHFILND